MKLIYFIFIISFEFFSFLLVIHTDEVSSESALFIYKLDGAVHFENSNELTLDSMEQKLEQKTN